MNQLPLSNVRGAQPMLDRRHTRAGVSLLEVMFSIGVVMIGLVGIGALLPIGGALAHKGAVADAAAQMAANATREFSARGMAIPATWRWYNTLVGPPQFTSPILPNGSPTLGMGPGTSFCLDPFFITAPDPNLPPAQYAAEIAARNRFPINEIFGDPGVLAMRRITLRNAVPNVFSPNVSSEIVAKQLFVGSDDLIFDLPKDRTIGPVQNFSFLSGSPVNPLKRSIKGELSWMATIVPKLDLVSNNTSSTRINPTDEYTLSIVVFDRRPVDREVVINVATGNPIIEDEVSERVVRVGAFYSGTPAFSGGDLTLVTRIGRGANDLELRSGDWVMFSRLKEVLPPTTPPTIIQIHKWFRVVNVGDEPVYDGTQWARDVTVVGPDWDYDPTGTIPTQVTIVRGVVDVHEKTIRLETSSMWTN